MVKPLQEKLVYLSPEDVRLMPAGHCLVINAEEQIVTLLHQETVRVVAQKQFPAYVFRALILLLKSTQGASYAQLFACLRCPEQVIRQLLAAPSAEQVREFQVDVAYWQRYLEQVALKGPQALNRELKPVRRAVKETRGLQPLLQQNGFDWRVRALYRRGYILLRAPVSVPAKDKTMYQKPLPQHMKTEVLMQGQAAFCAVSPL